MDRGLRVGAADRRPAGPAYPSCPHSGDERRELPPQRQQAQAFQQGTLLALAQFTAAICRDGLRSGLNAPRKAGRRPTLQPPPQINQSKASTTQELVYFLPAPVV